MNGKLFVSYLNLLLGIFVEFNIKLEKAKEYILNILNNKDIDIEINNFPIEDVNKIRQQINNLNMKSDIAIIEHYCKTFYKMYYYLEKYNNKQLSYKEREIAKHSYIQYNALLKLLSAKFLFNENVLNKMKQLYKYFKNKFNSTYILTIQALCNIADTDKVGLDIAINERKKEAKVMINELINKDETNKILLEYLEITEDDLSAVIEEEIKNKNIQYV